MAITRRQREVYDFISRFVTEHGYSPSFEEIGQGLKLNSLATVHKHITNLEKKGLLTRDYNRSRSIDLLPPKGKLKQSMSVNTGVVLPLMGRIAAGTPISAIQTRLQTLAMPPEFLGGGEHFALEVRGDSMIDAGIFENDTVIIRKQDTADTGDIVVALIDEEEATLKRLRKRGASIALEAANPAYETRIFGPDRVRVQGKMVSLLRRY